MFNETKIKEAFRELVHFTQPSDPSYPSLDSRLLTSSSGRSVNFVHPYLTIENLLSVAPQFDSFAYPDWASSTPVYGRMYSLGYNVVTPDILGAPVITNPFSMWLMEVMDQSAIELVSLVVQEKNLAGAGKTIMESLRLFEGPGLLTEREIGTGRFVGYEVIVGRNEHLLINIDQLALQTDEAIASLNIYLYSSASATPIATFDISTMGGLGFKWNKVDGKMFSLSYDPGYDTAGTYYVGYFEADLGTAQAISKRFDISRPCSSCNRYNFDAYRNWSKRMGIRAMSVDPTILTEAIDQSNVTYYTDRNFGLNLAVTARCDVSQFFIQHISLFADAYAKVIALNLMRQFAYSSRINVIPEMTRQGAMAELDAKAGSGSLYDETHKALKAINTEFSGFGNDCLPCTARNRIVYGAI